MVIALVAFLRLGHLWIPLCLFVFGGAGSGDQGGIDNSTLLNGYAAFLEMGFHRLVYEVLRSSRSALRVRSS